MRRALHYLAGVTVFLLATVATARASTIIAFQDGAVTPMEAGGNGVDVYAGTRDLTLRAVNERGKSGNTGGIDIVWVGAYNGKSTDLNRIVIDFDYGSLGAYLQANNLLIQSAVLELYYSNLRAPANPHRTETIDVFKSTTAFNEGGGTQEDMPALPGESCWNYQSYDPTNPTPWASAGGHGAADFTATIAGTLDSATVTTATGYAIDFDVTGAFALDGSDLATHSGFTLLARIDPANPNWLDFNGSGQAQFRSSEYATASYRPMLVFTLVPEPGTLALLGTGLLLLAVVRRRRKDKVAGNDG